MNMKIERPGIYSVPAEVYHRDDGICPAPSLSSTGARKLMRYCPAIFFYERNNPPQPSTAFKVGSAAHEWLLEGDTWPARHFVLPDDHNGRTNAGKALVADAQADGKRVITAEQFETVKAMRDALAAHPFAMAAFQNGEAEKSIYWQDEETGIWCRCRPDFLPRSGAIVCDYKTSDGVDPEHLRKSIAAYGYHIQAAWYLAGIRAVGAIRAPSFVFVFQDKNPPHLIVCVALDDVTLEWGRIIGRRARQTFAQCLRTGVWPGYADDIVELGLPIWAEKDLQRQHEAGLYETITPQGEAA